jgi:hypothetical protein
MNDTPSNPEAFGADRHGSGSGTKVRRLLPLTVWLCSDTSATAEATNNPNHGGGRADTTEDEYCSLHRRTVGHQLARHLITACTREGDLVAEAYTTDEATLAAAAGLGRRAVACVPDFPLARHIRARLDATLPHEAAAKVEMRPCRPDQMARGLADHLGQVGLLVAAPPPYRHDDRARPDSGRRCPVCRIGFWMNSRECFRLFMAAAWRVLRPGGHLAVITTARHEHGRLVDPAPRIIREAAGLRFRYVQHIIAVRVPVDGDTLVVQADPRGLAQLRDVRSRALPPVARVHADVCLFTKPQSRPGRGGDR